MVEQIKVPEKLLEIDAFRKLLGIKDERIHKLQEEIYAMVAIVS